MAVYLGLTHIVVEVVADFCYIQYTYIQLSVSSKLMTTDDGLGHETLFVACYASWFARTCCHLQPPRAGSLAVVLFLPCAL